MNSVSILLAAAGGAAGTALRFCLAELVLRHTAGCRFPVATFAANLAGCLLAGLLSGLADRYGFLSVQERIFLFTGLLGGFTTFSAFGLETFTLLRQHGFFPAAGYVLGSVCCGLLLVWLGFHLAAMRR